MRIDVCTTCALTSVDGERKTIGCFPGSEHTYQRVGPPTLAEALAVLQSFVRECEEWAEQREAWKLTTNRADAARDLAALFTWAPREIALKLAYFESDPKRPRPEWTGETAGNDSENRIARRGLLERFIQTSSRRL